jgi:hypothetical protein
MGGRKITIGEYTEKTVEQKIEGKHLYMFSENRSLRKNT